MREKLYESFNVAERLQLTIAALARNDNGEINKLIRTCPRYTYTGMDMSYRSALNSLSQVCLQLTVLLQYFHSRIQYSELLICHYGVLEDQQHELLLASAKTPNNIHQPLAAYFCQLQELQKVRTQFLSIFKAIYQAFLQFCTEVQITTADVLQWIDLTSLLDEFESYLDDTIKINQEWFAMAKKIFMEEWQC